MNLLHLADYRRATAALYGDVRDARGSPEQRCLAFREAKDRLFRDHPASPLDSDARARFRGLAYFPYDPSARVTATFDTAVEPERLDIHLREDGLLRLERAARARFELHGKGRALSVFRVMGYGGGLFLPFRDATSGTETYGGGRYLIDTIKHADLGTEGGELVLDFNYAYNPSCMYHPRWDCPLAPAENTLDVHVRAGEKAYGAPE